jgi:hypothetical protein
MDCNHRFFGEFVKSADLASELRKIGLKSGIFLDFCIVYRDGRGAVSGVLGAFFTI